MEGLCRTFGGGSKGWRESLLLSTRPYGASECFCLNLLLLTIYEKILGNFYNFDDCFGILGLNLEFHEFMFCAEFNLCVLPWIT